MLCKAGLVDQSAGYCLADALHLLFAICGTDRSADAAKAANQFASLPMQIQRGGEHHNDGSPTWRKDELAEDLPIARGHGQQFVAWSYGLLSHLQSALPRVQICGSMDATPWLLIERDLDRPRCVMDWRIAGTNRFVRTTFALDRGRKEPGARSALKVALDAIAYLPVSKFDPTFTETP